MIASNFIGDELVLFGGIERDAATRPQQSGYDIIVTVIGPRQTCYFPQVEGTWPLGECRLAHTGECARLSRRAPEPAARCHHEYRNATPPAAWPPNIPLLQRASVNIADAASDDPFRLAFIKIKTEQGPTAKHRMA